jgi:hypothetical protein
MVNDRKPVLAHNLVRKPVEVWAIEPRKLPGVLDLWVADQGVLTDPVAPWPLLEDGDADYFRGVPVGVDPRGDVVIGTLMASNYGIAGIMGSGKTSLVINLVCGAMLDPRVDIDVYVMAFNVDYDPMRRRLRTLVKGDEDEQIEAAIEALRGLRAEVTARGKILAELGGEETKVTRELAERDARLRPRLVIFDECREMFRHERYGDEAKELAIKVMMKARKCAIPLGFITPAPAADSLPRDLAKTVSHGVCFAIGDHQGNDAILGTGAHKSGVSATGLVAGEDVGTAMAKGFGPKAGLLRTHHIRKDKTVDQITPIVERALALRDGAGIGAAPAVEAAVTDHLADIAAVLVGHERVRTQEVLSLLAARDRATYGRWTFERLATALVDVAPQLGRVVGPAAVPGDVQRLPAGPVGGGGEAAAQGVAGDPVGQPSAGAGAGEQPGDRVGGERGGAGPRTVHPAQRGPVVQLGGLAPAQPGPARAQQRVAPQLQGALTGGLALSHGDEQSVALHDRPWGTSVQQLSVRMIMVVRLASRCPAAGGGRPCSGGRQSRRGLARTQPGQPDWRRR